MLQAYTTDGSRLMPTAPGSLGETTPPVWIDLLDPQPDGDKLTEDHLGLQIPSRAEMDEIELSSRLYTEDGAKFMTMVALLGLDTPEPSKTPIAFILKGNTLVTVRYGEPKPFVAYTSRAKNRGAMCQSGERVMLGLLEAMIDRIADALEKVGNDIDGITRGVFRNKSRSVHKKTHDLRTLIEQIGDKSELLTMILDSLASITRLVSYYTSFWDGDGDGRKLKTESRQVAKTTQRDALSLTDHARSLADRVSFLLDATLGMINLEQNQIIKIFSVAAVVFLPPTLVAPIYGMNFEFMPELAWPFGYPFALGLMVLSAVLPYLFFKRKGWL